MNEINANNTEIILNTNSDVVYNFISYVTESL